MESDRALLVVGPFRDETTSRIREAATAVDVPVAILGRCEEIAGALAEALPFAIVLRMDAHGAEQACAHVRSQARLAQVPIFGVTSELSDIAFTELFVWGGDDLVGVSSAQPLLRRLRALRSPGPGPRTAAPEAAADAARPSKGDAIVAGPVATWRSVMGRALYNGGYGVRFAATAEGLAQECTAEGVRVVVVSDDLQPDGGAASLASARGRGSRAAWVLVAPPKRMAEANASLVSLGRASAMDGFAPPENVLFVVNELLAARGVDKRASPRLLYGTSVAFRAAGRDEDEIGFSYNLSEGGAYVRTLAPPEPGQEVWLEMWPPRSERRVRLAGRVAWRRPFGPVGGATVPTGFGVQLTDGLAGDLDRWRAGCETFADSLLRLRAARPAGHDV
jgi:Tfp pilus assembly protein PilZ